MSDDCEVWEETRGDQWDWAVELEDDDGGPTALTGATVAGLIKWFGGSLPLTEANSRIVVEEPRTLGKFKVRVEEADNLVVPLGQLSELVLWMIDSAGDKRTFLRDPLKVSE